MNLKKYFADSKAIIDEALDRFLPSEKEEPKVIHRAMRYSVFPGGKRIRPILAMESSKVCGGNVREVIPVACAIELIHTYSLIHDDLPAMDDDDYRRGRPACHKAFGVANAILAGDALLTLAFNIIARTLAPAINAKVIRDLSGAISTKGMVGGQALDLEYRGKDKNEKTSNLINRLKTAKLFEASARAGAIVAGAGKRKIDAIAKFGLSFGMAFQMVDDIIDSEDHTKAFSADKAIADSRNFIEMAKASIKMFGRKADRLKDIADHALDKVR